MLKKTVLVMGLAAMYGVAMAESQNFDVSVTATVPTDTFYVSANGWDPSQVQTMGWNHLAERINPLQRNLDMKSTVGDITAYLINSPELSSGTALLPLTVTVNSKSLKEGVGNAEVVMIAEDAAIGGVVPMVVSADQKDRPEGGVYTGTVQMLFESVPVEKPGTTR
ncbi:CS1 type fimbrial major subunit [Burkholderia lata]|uniref:CS1 type fimbrial major subunit n=1 Tax=Burkholderia lata (strain ATCC 17760 / DSM 23089 / LMG 22485 / NCIMB 9086 / R18194 / 383) TaxID=482957 RepID=UPI00399B2912